MTHHTDAERAEFDLMRFAFESKGSEAYKAWLIEVRDGDSYKPWDVVNDWRNWQTAWQAARRAPAAPVPKGWKLVPDEANMTDEQAEAICRLANVCGGGAYGIYRAALAAAPHPPEADHIPDAGKMDTNVRNWMNAALSKDVACPACGLSGLHACPSASTAESQGADAVKALEKVLRAVQRHLPPERIGERETIAEIISIVDPWPLAKPPANET